jgi:hypothetical protein
LPIASFYGHFPDIQPHDQLHHSRPPPCIQASSEHGELPRINALCSQSRSNGSSVSGAVRRQPYRGCVDRFSVFGFTLISSVHFHGQNTFTPTT